MWETAFNIVGFGIKNIGVPLAVSWATSEIVGGPKPQQQSSSAPTKAAVAVRDSAPGTLNIQQSNPDASSSQNTLIIGAVALVAIAMLVKKK